jgi:uncharacterized surface protein with fasciclin (FAS1) repeats
VRPNGPLVSDAIRRRTCPLVRLPNFGQKTPTCPGYYWHPVMSHGGAYGYSNYATPYGKPTNHRTGYHPTSLGAPETTATAPIDDIVDAAVGAGNFDTLVAAVKAAGLVETLKGEGPFTVFAPTDEAFAKVPADQLAALLSDKEALIQVLTYHVVPGAVSSSGVSKLDSAKTVQGESIEIDTSDGIKVDGAKVVKADIRASNGVIHVIGTVIMPNEVRARCPVGEGSGRPDSVRESVGLRERLASPRQRPQNRSAYAISQVFR